VHDTIKCGPETKILPKILKFMNEYKINPYIMNEIKDAGLSEEKLNSAFSVYIYTLMNEHNLKSSIDYAWENKQRLCAKDPGIFLIFN
jgi:hypothetical protein